MKDKAKKKKAVVMEVKLCHQMEEFLKLLEKMHGRGFHPLNVVFVKFDDQDGSAADLELFAPKFQDAKHMELAQSVMDLIGAAMDCLPGTAEVTDVIH